MPLAQKENLEHYNKVNQYDCYNAKKKLQAKSWIFGKWRRFSFPALYGKKKEKKKHFHKKIDKLSSSNPKFKPKNSLRITY